jgi:hypothetical protein
LLNKKVNKPNILRAKDRLPKEAIGGKFSEDFYLKLRINLQITSPTCSYAHDEPTMDEQSLKSLCKRLGTHKFLKQFLGGLLKNFYANNYLYDYGKIPLLRRTD